MYSTFTIKRQSVVKFWLNRLNEAFLSPKITFKIILSYFLDPFVCDGSMSEVYANVPMYIDWIICQKRAHETTAIEGRDDSSDVSMAEPLFFEIVLNIFLMLQIY